ncbi:MAG: hypothetical protein D6801_08465, partial [Alphaproteobacteria bacterium]
MKQILLVLALLIAWAFPAQKMLSGNAGSDRMAATAFEFEVVVLPAACIVIAVPEASEAPGQDI